MAVIYSFVTDSNDAKYIYTYKDFTYNDFTLKINKFDITYIFLFTVIAKVIYRINQL